MKSQDVLSIFALFVFTVTFANGKFRFPGISNRWKAMLAAHGYSNHLDKYNRPHLLSLLHHLQNAHMNHLGHQNFMQHPTSIKTETSTNLPLSSRNTHSSVGQHEGSEQSTTTPLNEFEKWKSSWLGNHYETCGKQFFRPINPHFRIIGGTAAKEGSWPWMVSLYFLPFKQSTCAGILIDKEWVITAAHCMDLPFVPPNMDIKQFIVVRVGIHNASNFDMSENEQRTRVKYYYLPSEFHVNSPFAFDHDIALLRLEEPVEYTNYVKPVCLPKEDDDDEICVITGWGRQKRPGGSESDRIDKSAWPESLRQATVPIIHSEECAKKEGYEDKVTDNMICAGYTSGQVDSCTGDSGGPLQCVKDKQWHLTGITSWGGRHYTECAEPEQPGVYTRVNSYTEWLLSVIYNDSL